MTYALMFSAMLVVIFSITLLVSIIYLDPMEEASHLLIVLSIGILFCISLSLGIISWDNYRNLKIYSKTHEKLHDYCVEKFPHETFNQEKCIELLREKYISIK